MARRRTHSPEVRRFKIASRRDASSAAQSIPRTNGGWSCGNSEPVADEVLHSRRQEPPSDSGNVGFPQV